MKTKIILCLLLALFSTVAFGQVKVSTLPALPADSATYVYGITNSGTDGKVPINTVGGLAIFSSTGTALMPYANDATDLGKTSARFSSLFLTMTGGAITFTDGGGSNSDVVAFVHNTGPTWRTTSASTDKIFQLDLSNLSNHVTHTAVIQDRSGTMAFDPVLSQKFGNYTLLITDANNEILHAGLDTIPQTFTIPANTGVAYAIGTKITFINQHGAGTITIAITTDTMRLAGAGTTGSRTLAADGVAVAIKITSTEWIISGTNLT